MWPRWPGQELPSSPQVVHLGGSVVVGIYLLGVAVCGRDAHGWVVEPTLDASAMLVEGLELVDPHHREFGDLGGLVVGEVD